MSLLLLFQQAAGVSYTLTGLAGSYTLTGGSASLNVGRKITANAGTYSLTGGSATLTKAVAGINYSLTANAGSYAISGGTAALNVGRKITANAGSYSLTGGDASLIRGRNLIALAGSYAITGGSATLTKTGAVAYSLSALAGVYAITGGSADLSLKQADEGGDGYGKSKTPKGFQRQSRMVYLEHEGKIVVFANAAQADEWLAQQAKPTKKVAGSKTRKAQPDIPKTAQVLDTRALGAEFINFAPSEDLQRLLAQNDLRRVLEIHQRIEMQRSQEDEDDIEMLLMVL